MVEQYAGVDKTGHARMRWLARVRAVGSAKARRPAGACARTEHDKYKRGCGLVLTVEQIVTSRIMDLKVAKTHLVALKGNESFHR